MLAFATADAGARGWRRTGTTVLLAALALGLPAHAAHHAADLPAGAHVAVFTSAGAAVHGSPGAASPAPSAPSVRAVADGLLMMPTDLVWGHATALLSWLQGTSHEVHHPDRRVVADVLNHPQVADVAPALMADRAWDLTLVTTATPDPTPDTAEPAVAMHVPDAALTWDDLRVYAADMARLQTHTYGPIVWSSDATDGARPRELTTAARVYRSATDVQVTFPSGALGLSGPQQAAVHELLVRPRTGRRADAALLDAALDAFPAADRAALTRDGADADAPAVAVFLAELAQLRRLSDAIAAGVDAPLAGVPVVLALSGPVGVHAAAATTAAQRDAAGRLWNAALARLCRAVVNAPPAAAARLQLVAGPVAAQRLTKRADPGARGPRVRRAADEAVCPTTAASCLSTFDQCTMHGTCTQQKTIVAGVEETCYLCACGTDRVDDAGKPIPGFTKKAHYVGNACQYEDIAPEFNLLFFTGLGLFIVVTFSISLLASVGKGAHAGVLNLAGAGGRPKAD
ncbi:hypothetical protein CXG81DRAFT_26598 [Caulochytrium protostelioides]|uniref:Vacuolar sorting protein Vps3844 C-terminal domain-containing protein n=1 Tax=Caulochytrium protostelioides TaxID=1555241 RepID=A0A4P9X698_9FUNG|nr:hypothetical protein CXG81DRAFT_26598 [Caulochytrium protostelioides]|eukprot:RKP00693.1 hypothetical protein CXG81DRAFT_26598 [Caulochytrium protostelioides]